MKRAIDDRTDPLLDEIVALTKSNAASEKAKDAAEAANLAKTRYLVGVSHEIRSPLNAIYGYAQLLERGAAIDPLEAGRVIRSASEHLTSIVEGLLDISRIESGVHKLDRNIVALPKFLEAIVAMMRVQAEANGLRLDYLPPRNLPDHVRTDEKRLRQILVNLLSNAVKYTPSGSVTLTVRYQGLIADFEISDTGIGIAPDDLSGIFEPFNRGSAGQVRSLPGTGLGLAITRMLAQVMGGDVSVASTVGEGSVFQLRLMLPEANSVASVAAPPGQVTGYVGPRRTLLLVDDDPAQLRALERLLQPLGFTVYAASSGTKGLDLAKDFSPDLVLLDIQLRDLTGWEVVQRLRALQAEGNSRSGGDTMKIVMVSANAHEFAGGGDRKAGHDGFVPKPVQFDVLLDVIATQLGLSWQFQPVGSTVDAGLPLLGSAIPAHRMDHLRYLGQIGYVRGIETELDALDVEIPAAAPLVEQLRIHVRKLDLSAYLSLLDRHG